MVDNSSPLPSVAGMQVTLLPMPLIASSLLAVIPLLLRTSPNLIKLIRIVLLVDFLLGLKALGLLET
jgi:hypothetical protein